MRDRFLKFVCHPNCHRMALTFNNIAICVFWAVKEASVTSVALHGMLAVLILIAAVRGLDVGG